MALDTYAELQTAVAAWLQRTDLAAAQVQEFIRLAEERISADLADLPFMQQSPSPIALAQGASTLSLPADTVRLISARLVSPDRPITLTTNDALQRALRSTTETGAPRLCALSTSAAAGALGLTLWPVADQAYTVQVLIAGAVPALSVSNTNFVLTRGPSLYLYGSLLSAEAFTVNDPRVMFWEAQYAAALARFRNVGDADVMLATDVPVGHYGYNILGG